MMQERFLIAVMVLVTVIATSGGAAGGWLFSKEQTAWEKSGLDLDSGYDVNMVVEVEGTVESYSLPDHDGPFVIALRCKNQVYYLVAGPRWFWDQHGLKLATGDQLSAVGAKAQGSDGNLYLLVKSITNKTTGVEVMVRDDIGAPRWSRQSRTSTSRTGSGPRTNESRSSRITVRQGFGRGR